MQFEVGNLVGNDVVRFQQNLFCMSIIPAASVQFIGGVVILIYTLGLAGVVGLLCMLAMLFLNTRRAPKWREWVLGEGAGWQGLDSHEWCFS